MTMRIAGRPAVGGSIVIRNRMRRAASPLRPLIGILLLTCPALATAASARECHDNERVKVRGVILFVEKDRTYFNTANTKPATGTCDILDVIYSAGAPASCVRGATFTATGKALQRFHTRLIADSVTCP